jgi:hypothetical protein
VPFRAPIFSPVLTTTADTSQLEICLQDQFKNVNDHVPLSLCAIYSACRKVG